VVPDAGKTSIQTGVATVTIDPTGQHNARKSWRDAHRNHGIIQTGLDSIWHFLNGVASGVGHLFTHSVADAFKTTWATIHEIVDAYKELVGKYLSIYYWVQIHVLKYLFHLVMRKYDQAIAHLMTQVKRLIRLIYITTATALATALDAVRREKTARQKADRRIEASITARIRAMHRIIEQEAVSAYRVDHDQRVNTIIRLLEFAARREPLLKDAVGVLVRGLLDLIAVDNPVARLALGFLIKDVIDKLGVDRIAGHLISELMAPLLGEPKPHDLHAVIMDLSARLSAVEGQLATFMERGGSEVEQAGSLWRDITSPAGAAAILGFTGAAIVDPDGWAKTVTDVIGKPANEIAAATTRLVRGG
jgi:hypothetical protein